MNVNPKFYRYLQANSIQFLVDVVSTCEKSDLETLGLTSQVHPLKNYLENISDSYVHIRTSEYTARLLHLDGERDGAYIGVTGVIHAYIYHYDEMVKAAAYKLIHLLDSYGKHMHRDKYQVETVKLRNFCSDLKEKDEYSAAVASLGLESWVLKLDELNEAFSSVYLERVDESAAAGYVDKPALIKEGISAYNNLCVALDANAFLNPSEALSELIARLDALAQKYNESK